MTLIPATETSIFNLMSACLTSYPFKNTRQSFTASFTHKIQSYAAYPSTLSPFFSSATVSSAAGGSVLWYLP